MESNETPIYDLKDVEKRIKISRRTLREYVKSGQLEAEKIGRAYYTTEAKLIKFVEGQR